MNQISQLTKSIAGLQKIERAVNATAESHWKSPEVRETALLVRNIFDTFEQKWRDMLQKHKFFVFCIPKYAVWDGPPVFLHNIHGGDESTKRTLKKTVFF